MSNTLESLRNKIERATDLASVVSTMKALAAANIGQYEKSVQALAEYYQTVEMGLSIFFQQNPEVPGVEPSVKEEEVGAVVFGSDQGLVGQFNDRLASYVNKSLGHFPGEKKIWAVGERVFGLLDDFGLPVTGYFEVPNAIHSITPLIGNILAECTTDILYVFHNQPTTGEFYEPGHQRLLPLDRKWRREISQGKWPNLQIPQVLGEREATLGALVREYLFVSLFKACAESLASENGSRLAAMQRAEQNIDELMDDLNSTFHRLRQENIDHELFDLVAGFEALKKDEK